MLKEKGSIGIADCYPDLIGAILSAAIRHSSGGWNPGDEPNNLDTGLRRYDVKLFLEIESLILGLRRRNQTVATHSLIRADGSFG